MVVKLVSFSPCHFNFICAKSETNQNKFWNLKSTRAVNSHAPLDKIYLLLFFKPLSDFENESRSLKLVWMSEPWSLSRYHHAQCHGHWNWYEHEKSWSLSRYHHAQCHGHWNWYEHEKSWSLSRYHHAHWNWYEHENPDHCQVPSCTLSWSLKLVWTWESWSLSSTIMHNVMVIETGMNMRTLITCQGTIMHIVMVIETGMNMRTLITVKVPSCTLSWSLKLVWMWEPCSLSRYYHAHCHGHWNWYACENPDHCRGTIMHILKTCLNSNWDKANTEVSSKLRHASLSPSNTDPFTANNCIALMQLPSRLSLQDSLSCPKTLDWRTLIYARIREKLLHSFKQDARWHALVKWKTIWQGHPMVTWGQRKD